MACFNRIQTFLNSEARRDHRLPLYPDTSISNFHTGGSDIEIQNLAPPDYQGALLIIQNASFAWSSGGRPAVSDISFTLPWGQFCFIIGPVGSGKSTLLKGIMGETPSSKGFVRSYSPGIAYVDQTPWIQNGTIQQNILGISTFEEPWYSVVVRAYALEYDISKLPKGHGTFNV